jgi:hypothetical protein
VTKTEELTPQQVAIYREMERFHTFAAECMVIFGDDHPVSLIARRIAQRARYQLLVGVDPDLEEVRDRVTAEILGRRARLAELTAK